MLTLDTKFRKTALLTPSEYLKLRTEHPGRIKSARMIPPRIGKDKHFGKMLVVLSSGYYEAIPK